MKTFYVSLILSILLLVGGFMSPPLGIIDSSVLSAVGLLFAFATLAQLPQMLAAIAQGRTFRLTKGDLTAEVTSNSGETWQENLIQSGSLHKGWAWLYCIVVKVVMVKVVKLDFDEFFRKCRRRHHERWQGERHPLRMRKVWWYIMTRELHPCRSRRSVPWDNLMCRSRDNSLLQSL